MSDPSPPKLRVPVDDARREPDPARTGCLWVGGIVGVLVGIVFVFFGVPPLLNFLFPSETIEVGETYEDDKLSLRVLSVVRDELEKEPLSDAAYVIRLSVVAASSWSTHYDNFVLVLEDGTEVRSEPLFTRPPLDERPTSAKVPQGNSILELIFSNGEPTLSPPDSLHLEEPPVKFELPPVSDP